jgi:hypothetical protein
MIWSAGSSTRRCRASQNPLVEFGNGREERYLIVAFTVITDVPEAVGPCPVALMAIVSLPLYLAFAVYS